MQRSSSSENAAARRRLRGQALMVFGAIAFPQAALLQQQPHRAVEQRWRRCWPARRGGAAGGAGLASRRVLRGVIANPTARLSCSPRCRRARASSATSLFAQRAPSGKQLRSSAWPEPACGRGLRRVSRSQLSCAVCSSMRDSGTAAATCCSNAAAPCSRTNESGSCSGGRNRKRMLRGSLACGSAASSARPAARRPAASPSKLKTTRSVKRNSFGHVLGGAGRAQRRDGVAEARLRERHHVHVALDDQRVARLAQRGAGLVQAVQLAALDEQRRLRRVEVFGLAVVDHSAAEADHLAAHRADRKHDAVAKAVVALLLPRPSPCAMHQAGLDEQRIVVPRKHAGQVAPARGRVAQSQSAPAISPVRPRPLQVVDGPRAGFQRSLVVVCRPARELRSAVCRFSALFGARARSSGWRRSSEP